MDEERQELAEWLEVAMKKRGWSQVHLAKASGVSRETINKVLRGRGSTTDSTLERLAGALRVPAPEQRFTTEPRRPQGVGDEAALATLNEMYKAARKAVREAPGAPDGVPLRVVEFWLLRLFEAALFMSQSVTAKPEEPGHEGPGTSQ